MAFDRRDAYSHMVSIRRSRMREHRANRIDEVMTAAETAELRVTSGLSVTTGRS